MQFDLCEADYMSLGGSGSIETHVFQVFQRVSAGWKLVRNLSSHEMNLFL